MAYANPSFSQDSTFFTTLIASKNSTGPGNFISFQRTGAAVLKLYEDGALAATQASTQTLAAVPDSKFCFGAIGNSDSSSAAFLGAGVFKFGHVGIKTGNLDSTMTALSADVVAYETNVIAGGRV